MSLREVVAVQGIALLLLGGAFIGQSIAYIRHVRHLHLPPEPERDVEPEPYDPWGGCRP